MLKKLTFYLFLFFIFSLGFMYPSFVFFGALIQISDFIFLLVFFLWILTIIARHHKFKSDKLFIFLALYLIVAFVATIFSPNFLHSLVRFSSVIYLSSLPVICFNLIETTEDFKKVVYAWLSAVSISLLLGIFTFFLFYIQPGNSLLNYTTYHYGAVPVGNYPRLASTFISASMFCNYLSVSLLLVFIACKLKWINSLLFYIFYSAIVFCAVFTISSGLGGIFLSIGIWIWSLFRHRQKILAKLSLIGGICIALGFILLNIFALQKYSTAPYSFNFFGFELFPSPRLLVWQQSFSTFTSNFLTGAGLGEDSCRVIFQNTEGGFSVLTDAHNIFLSVASQSGIFGLLAVLLLTFGILIRKNDNLISLGLWLGVISAFIYQGLTGSFEDTRHVWVAIGLLIASRSIFKKND